LIGLALTLVAKHFAALKYTKEDEEEPIAFLQCIKKTRKRTNCFSSMPKEDKEEDVSSPFNS
jgi:hypothetical protein